MQRRAPEAEAFIAVATFKDGGTQALSVSPSMSVKEVFEALWPASDMGVLGQVPISIALVPDSSRTPASEPLPRLDPLGDE